MTDREKVACTQALDSCALEIVLLTYLLTYSIGELIDHDALYVLHFVCCILCILHATAFVYSAAFNSAYSM